MWFPSRGQPVILAVTGRADWPVLLRPLLILHHFILQCWPGGSWLFLWLSSWPSPARQYKRKRRLHSRLQSNTAAPPPPPALLTGISRKHPCPQSQAVLFRCFEVNEFAGVNFVRSPCRFLKSVEKKTQMDPEEEKEMSFEKQIETRQRKKVRMVSKFQTAVQNCCDNVESKAPYRWRFS